VKRNDTIRPTDLRKILIFFHFFPESSCPGSFRVVAARIHARKWRATKNRKEQDMTSDKGQQEAINTALRRAFRTQGVDLEEVWAPMSDDTELENRQLAHLLDWLMTYRAHPDRAEMEAMGFEFPPVEPDIDPDTDWMRFERWVRGAPLQWNFRDEYGPMREASAMSDDQLEEELGQLISFLEDRRVDVSLEETVPARVKYMHLRRILEDTSFDHTAPGSFCVIGCNSYCPD